VQGNSVTVPAVVAAGAGTPTTGASAVTDQTERQPVSAPDKLLWFLQSL
jgi:hypothetical protein